MDTCVHLLSGTPGSLQRAHSGTCHDTGRWKTVRCGRKLKETRPKSIYYEFMQIKFKTSQNWGDRKQISSHLSQTVMVKAAPGNFLGRWKCSMFCSRWRLHRWIHL